MRKLKLQMNMTIDGFVARPNGELDWMTWDENDVEYFESVIDRAASSDTIIMGRKMTDVFVDYWTSVLETPDNFEYPLAKLMIDIPKVVFTKTLNESRWPNTTLAKIVDEVRDLKSQDGKDMIAYGGAGFATSLINNDLVDEYHFLISPVAIGKGMSIFGDIEDKIELKPIDVTPYRCGVTLHKYLPVESSMNAGV